ncbi:MAG: 23S rRNA (pseudouridine(1915)-N(3))-methyltransferase RlmH [Thermodesulfobacteriota bacterium]
MNFTVVTVGKINKDFILDGINNYYKRINHYKKIELLYVREERIAPKITTKLILRKEGNRILEKVPKDGLWLSLDRKGREMSSEEHFEFLNAQAKRGLKKLYYIIGGPLGLSSEVLGQCDERLSLSRMTFPHELCVLLLLEQLYRYVNFMAGEKYHK